MSIDVLDHLPRGTVSALEEAVKMAAEWRGYYTNDPVALDDFDTRIKKMRKALADVKRQQRAIRHLMNHVADVRQAVSHMH